jgi:hypothetical protein
MVCATQGLCQWMLLAVMVTRRLPQFVTCPLLQLLLAVINVVNSERNVFRARALRLHM